MRSAGKLGIFATAAVLVLAPTSTAVADDPPPDESFTWPPPEGTDGEWLPVPEQFLEPTTYAACGSTVTVTQGDVNEAEYRARVHRKVEWVDYRGAWTVDVVRESDGARIDELDIGGPGREVYSYWTYDVSYEGPSLIGSAGSPKEAAAWAEKGLPELFYYTEGRWSEHAAVSHDPEATDPFTKVTVTEVPEHVVDVCDLLDGAGEH